MDKLFDDLFNSIKQTIIPSPVWADAWSGRRVISSSVIPGVVGCTSCLVKIKAGEQVKSFSSIGRKMIFLGTPFGAFLIYQHYPEKSEKLRVCADNKVWDDLNEYNQSLCTLPFHKPSLKYFLSRDDLLSIITYSFAGIKEKTT